MDTQVLQKLSLAHRYRKNEKTTAVPLRAHHERRGFFGKTIVLIKIEGSKKRGRPHRRWVDSIKKPYA